MKLYSYIITHDTGFSPNPFWGYCTLACCKPSIRRTAQKGDWIVGLSPKRHGNKIVFAMEVTEEPLSFDKYHSDPRFSVKIPDMQRKKLVYRTGDNIYRPKNSPGSFERLPNPYHDEENMPHDLAGEKVLISDHFYFFGDRAVELPEELRSLISGRGHKCRFSAQTVHGFLRFIHQFRPGVTCHPTKWPQDDTSWIEGVS